MDRLVRGRQHRLAPGHQERHLRSHPRLEQAVRVPDPDDHREHRNTLLDNGLRLDLEDFPSERSFGKRLHPQLRAYSRLDLPDVRLVDESADLDLGEVGHPEEQGAAAHVAGGRGDHLADLGVLLDHGPVDGGPHGHVLEALLRDLQRRLGADELGARVRVVERRLLVLLLGDHLRLEHLPCAAQRGLGSGESGAGDVEVGLGLGIGLARLRLLHLDEELAAEDVVADLDGHLDDLA